MSFIFGCRRRDEDYLYRDELEAALTLKYLDNLIVAYSRQDDKKYVQDKLKENTHLLEEVLGGDKGIFYCCGNFNMSKAVIAVIHEWLETSKGLDTEKAKNRFEELEKEGRICIEAWG